MAKGDQLECSLMTCEHEWIQRGDEKPLACPKCKRYDWEGENQEKSKNKLKEKHDKEDKNGR